MSLQTSSQTMRYTVYPPPTDTKFHHSPPPDSLASAWYNFSRCTRTPLPWMEEFERTALTLAESVNKPIWVCASGGIDSESICEVFLRLKLPFSVLSLKYTNGENAHDLQYAEKWCHTKKVPHKIVSLDLRNWANIEVDEYIKEGYSALTIGRYMTLKEMSTVDDMGGFAICGDGAWPYKLDWQMKPYLEIHRGSISPTPMEWCRRNNTLHEPFFYYNNPEFILAWLRIPLIRCMYQNPEILCNPLNSNQLKGIVMRSYFIHQEPRPKWDGFETVADIRALVEDKAASLHPQTYVLYLSDLIRQLEPLKEKNELPQQNIQAS